MILFAGIGGVLVLALGIGSFFIFKTLSNKHDTPPASAQSNDAHQTQDASKDKKEDKKDDSKKDSDPKAADGKPDDKKADDPQDPNGKKKDENKGTPNFGNTFTIQKMDLNLGNIVENRFLRLGLAIEYRGNNDQLEELKKRESQIRDIIISTASSKSRKDLLSNTGKEQFRREILNKINEVTDRPVQNVFFTEFLVE